MKNALLAILLCGVAVAACEQRRTVETPPETPQVEAEWREGGATRAEVDIRADMESGEVALKLPGGLEGKVKLPEGLEADTRFDLDGIGRYPGARLTSVDVKASDTDGQRQGRVVLGFSAPGTADAVADWYEQALVKKGRSVARTGTTVTGTTEDGDPMVIAITEGSGGRARGRITITETRG
jgi:hypothetical protein